jgi:hypothetical protein
MNGLALWVNAAIFFTALLVLYVMFRSTLRKKACFEMYAIRDDLVYLVASGQLSEDNHVFQHYYTRANALLASAPDIGIDNLLEAIFTQRTSRRDFVEFLARAESKAQRLFQDVAFENPQVRCTVANYYSGVRNMILAHSSSLRLLYVLVRYSPGYLGTSIVRWIPGGYGRALLAAEYANHEAEIMRGTPAPC